MVSSSLTVSLVALVNSVASELDPVLAVADWTTAGQSCSMTIMSVHYYDAKFKQ